MTHLHAYGTNIEGEWVPGVPFITSSGSRCLPILGPDAKHVDDFTPWRASWF